MISIKPKTFINQLLNRKAFLKNPSSICILTVLLNTGLISPVTSAAVTNKELKVGIAQEFETLNPIVMSMAASFYLSKFVQRALITLDADSKWVPVLVKEIPSFENKKASLITENGKKKIIAYWELLDNANWGDGKPVLCEDLAFTQKVASHPFVSVGEKEQWTQIEKIEWDPKTPKKCKFVYQKANWDFYRLAQFIPLPKHLEEPVFKKYGQEKEGYERNSNYVKNRTEKGLYNGPYVVSEIVLGDHITFTPNPFFYGSKPKIEKFIVKLIPNTGTLEANLRSGTIDMISTLGLDMDQALAFDAKVKKEDLPYTVHFVPSVTYEHIDLKLDNPILKDVKVRKALLLSINREDLVNSLYQGKIKTADHLFAPKDPWYTNKPEDVTIYKYSKREANKLLDEAGWKIGADGYRFKDGKKLSLDFMTTTGNKTRELVQVYLQQQWKQVGIEILPKNQLPRVFFGETVKKRGFDGLIMYAWVQSPENTPRSTVHSSQIPSEKNAFTGQNTSGWINKDVDQWIEQLDVEFDYNKRIEIAHKIAKAYTEEIPVLPLYYRSDISVTPKNLKNYRMTGHQYYESGWVENWSLE